MGIVVVLAVFEVLTLEPETVVMELMELMVEIVAVVVISVICKAWERITVLIGGTWLLLLLLLLSKHSDAHAMSWAAASFTGATLHR